MFSSNVYKLRQQSVHIFIGQPQQFNLFIYGMNNIIPWEYDFTTSKIIGKFLNIF